MNLNTSIFSIKLISIYFFSSFFQINHLSCNRQSFIISDSHFSHSFPNILYSSINKHTILLQNTIFRNVQSSAIYLTSEESISSFKSHCYFRDDFIPNPQSGNLIIRNKETSGDAISNFEDHRPFFILQNQYTCGYLKIAGCIFKNCNSRKDGGGIFVSQHENILIHETLFDSCHTEGYCGGCCCICGKKMEYDGQDILLDEQLPQADIQYCCFQNSYGAFDFTMGTAILIAAVKMNLNYSSSNNCSCHIRSQGAQFDIQSETPTSEHMNMTGGISVFCGSMEYRYSNHGYFRFQTAINISSKYCIAFTYSGMKEVSVNYCNIISNTVTNINGGGSNPTLIVIADIAIIIQNFYFINNNFIVNNGFYMSRMKNANGTFTILNCYFDDNNENRYIKDFATYNNCVFGTSYFTQCGLTHVSLGACAGNKTAEPIILSNTFTPSFYFSQSLDFSSTSDFSNSNFFSYSKEFTKTYGFTFSDLLTDSNKFTASEHFSGSSHFSFSEMFTFSDLFNDSNKFTSSEHFSGSSQFSFSEMFTFSDLFNDSNKFTSSEHFSGSSQFSFSEMFTFSDLFTDSNKFTASEHFSGSSQFSFSKMFTFSDLLTDSNKFTTSEILSKTNRFSFSKIFTKTKLFSNTHTEIFTLSTQFFVSSYQPKKKLSIWIIILIPIIILLLLITILIIIFFLYKRKNKNNSTDENENNSQKLTTKKEAYDESTNFVSEDDTDYDLDFWLYFKK